MKNLTHLLFILLALVLTGASQASAYDFYTGGIYYGIGYGANATAPIYSLADIISGVQPAHFVDPVPQALTLTSIVIGACVDAMALSLVVMIYRKYRSVNADDVRRLQG